MTNPGPTDSGPNVSGPNDPEPAETRRLTPLHDPDQVLWWLLGDDRDSSVGPDAAARLPADHPALRGPVTDRLFVHGLLRSVYDVGTDAAEARVRRAMQAITAPAAPAQPPQGTRAPMVLRFPGRRWWAAAAAVLIAAGLGMFALPGGSGPGPNGVGPGEATAAEVVQLAARRAAEEVDREYRIGVYDADERVIREHKLFVSGRKWALQFDERGGWMGFDGSDDWLVVPGNRAVPDWAKERIAGRLRGLLGLEIPQLVVADIVGDAGRYRLTNAGRGPAPDRPGSDCIHVIGERRGALLSRMEVWADAGDGLPVVVEMRADPEHPAVKLGVRARRMRMDYLRESRRPEGFFTEAHHRPAGAAPVGPRAHPPFGKAAPPIRPNPPRALP
jgi:hypothetical protein